MTMPPNINPNYLFTLLGVKEAELALLRDQIARITQELEQVQDQLKESSLNSKTKPLTQDPVE